MKVTPTELPEVLLLEPKVYGDERGFFFESYNRRARSPRQGSMPSSCRTITRAPRGACCAACITRSSTPRASWCA